MWATRAPVISFLETCTTTADCDDGSSCNGTESCSAEGFCVHSNPVDCSHLDDVCSVGSCNVDSGECELIPRFDGGSCDDGQWCTENDICTAGQCIGEQRECGERGGYI
ncbi:MAG: hypothetical protein HN348_23665 [Proteobacteria bacterium]|nr:hypothetical protein [Pseudomonadota bacterium]